MEIPNKEMPFIDHLEELRWHIIRAVIAISIFTVIAFSFMDFIFHEVLLGPVRADFWTYKMFCKLSDSLCIDKINFKMQNRTMAGQFTMSIVAGLISGVVMAFPYVFWEFWRFVKPGLSATERKYASGAVIFVTTLFALGLLFGYYLVTPLSVNFLINYQLDPAIENIIDINSYITFICMLVVGSGLMFQLPVVIYILTRIGIVGPKFLRKFRKHAIVGIFIVAAIVTPSPDFFTQSIVAVPLIILYEISIFISAAVERRREKEIFA